MAKTSGQGPTPADISEELDLAGRYVDLDDRQMAHMPDDR
jgi:hypothetical protein